MNTRNISQVLYLSMIYLLSGMPQSAHSQSTIANSTKPTSGAKILDSGGGWREVERSRVPSNIKVAKDIIDEIFLGSRFKSKLEENELSDIAQALFLYSSVDTISNISRTILFYNGLADIFVLGRSNSNGQLESFGLISGRALSKAIDLPEDTDKLRNILLQRPILLRNVKKAMERAANEKRDISNIFRQYVFDLEEKNLLAASIYGMALGIGHNGFGPCVSKASTLLADIVAEEHRVPDVSRDIRQSYQLLTTGDEDSEKRIVLWYGDVLVGRSRVMILIDNKKGKCMPDTVLTQTILD